MRQWESSVESAHRRLRFRLTATGVAMLMVGAAVRGQTGSPAPTTAPAATQAAADSGPAASLITLHMKNASADKVYAAVFRQAGVPLRTVPDNLFRDGAQPTPPLSIDVDGQPFWEVIQQLYANTRLSLILESPGDVRLARTMPIFPGPQSLAGPFLFAACQFEAVVNLTANGDAPSAKGDSPVGCQLVLLVYAEPRLKLLSVSPVNVDEAVDDNGNSLVPAHVDNHGGPANNGAGWPQITAALKFPEKNPGKRITHLHGTETMVVADTDGKPRQVTVPIDLKDLDMNLKGE